MASVVLVCFGIDLTKILSSRSLITPKIAAMAFFVCDRSCMESLQKLSLPPETLDRVKQLTGDLRLLCAKEVFKEAVEGKVNTQIHTQIFIISHLTYDWVIPNIWIDRVEITWNSFHLDIKSLHCNEVWCLDHQEGVGRITNLVRE